MTRFLTRTILCGLGAIVIQRYLHIIAVEGLYVYFGLQTVATLTELLMHVRGDER